MSESRKNRYLERASQITRDHLISTVMGVLCVSWVATSYFTFLAESDAAGANIKTFGQALWWGIVTFLTVGYGDLYPVTATGRVLAGGLMFVGVMGIAIITSKISSYFLEQALKEGRGVVDTSKLKDHFIVCGWKEDMGSLLEHILDFNEGMDASDLLMVAPVSPAIVEDLRSHPRLKRLQILIGNYCDSATLKRAAPERARKVLILADRTPHANGTIPTMNEVDAKTIMTAMTLSNIARGTLVTAEILDHKMEQYLKLAHVSEIIYSREYSRLLVGNASGGTGIANIIYDLLDPHTSARISTGFIEEEWVGKTYAEFKAHYEATYPLAQVVGVLENTGNTYRIKELALRRAQKTPDMNRLLENLRSVKELKCNHPIFAPGNDYVIPEGSLAILILSQNRTGTETHERPEEKISA